MRKHSEREREREREREGEGAKRAVQRKYWALLKINRIIFVQLQSNTQYKQPTRCNLVTEFIIPLVH